MDFVFAFMIIRWRLYEIVFMSGIVLVEPKVSKRWKIVIEHSIAIVLSYTTQLNDTVHLLCTWEQVSITHELLEILTIELKWLLRVIWKAWIFYIFFSVIVLVYQKWWY